ncbi:GTP cyclohydrolase II RibA [Brevibacterium sp. R8603A2]|uniref:GTP cyclohydrolase II RibA n=1 Tax=Brevibacterium sp. R8603A2 TaxID=2929779 RepID=UPI001FFBEBF4|nr:GTP cyclohydrolase II RibA [Brevibacterium sp. R8603A2]MCK1803430.1 GTP cyclohydrolase II RibA [Brevibacterium sp. R8603A2]
MSSLPQPDDGPNASPSAAQNDLPALVLESETSLPTDHGVFTTRAYTSEGVTHVAMYRGDPGAVEAPLVRLHSECLTGDALGSHRCDCGDQLEAALQAIAAAGTGILLYLRGHEGRGIGLAAKLRAYALQDDGLDTVDANRALGLPDDARDYRAAAAILHELDCPRIRLLSSNPTKAEALARLGIEVPERLALQVPDRPENVRYLQTKRSRMRHDSLSGQPVGDDPEDLPLYAALAAHSEVVAQLAQSADGFIAARGGDAEFVSGEADRTHLHRLRAAVDAVVVGAGTVVADDPQLTVRAVAGTNPLRVLLDPHARIPAGSAVLRSPDAPTLWLVGPDAEVPAGIGDHVEIARLPHSADGEPVDPAAVIALVRERVPGSILVEGGGRTVSDFLAAGVLDRIFLTSAPVLIGDGVPGIRFRGSPVMAQAMRTPFRRYAFGEDVCTEFVLSDAAQAHSAERPARPADGA